MNTNYCDYCHGDGWRLTNIGNKPVKCDECCGTGRATGAYESIPKVNGLNFWRVIEFIAAVIVLIVVGIIILPSFLYAVIKDSGWVKQLNQEPPKRSDEQNDSYSHS